MDQNASRDLGETSKRQRCREVTENDPILEPKHKIFLSHSGAQKEFVDHLCKALEDRFYYPFFDRRHESLPKGERFPELIVQAAEQCEMLIVVVSDEYFMSKWPMIELSAFVQAHKLHHESKNSTTRPRIFPLFYGLSMDDLEDANMRRRWFQEWESLAEGDPRNRIVVSDWKYALDVLRSFNGLSYDRNMKEVVVYEEAIVSYVSKSIRPDICWDDSHVQGKSTICEVIGEKIEGVGVCEYYNVKVVGLHGVGGIGKTTTCHTLCNEFSSKFEGRVCHVEFPSVSWNDSKEFFQKVLQDLTRKGVDVVQQLDEGQCKDLLRKSLFKERVFLALDNVSDSHQSMELAKAMLELPYHVDSLVIVTARSQSVLELLGINGGACLEMPDLGEIDAVKLFLNHAIGGREFFEDEEKHDIMTCVRRCYFSKGVGQGYHYHPLALKSLGLQLGFYGKNPSSWVKHLSRVRAFSSSCGENPVFDILRSGFKLLSEEDQTLFMDVWFFMKKMWFNMFDSCMSLSRLCTLHMQDEEEISQRLRGLEQKGFLQLVDLRFGRVAMHDLYMEFAELEVQGYFHKSTTLRERMWVYIKNGDLTKLKCKPNGGCWDRLIRLFIDHVSKEPNIYEEVGVFGSLEGIKWDYFSNVEVLDLDFGFSSRAYLHQGSLNLEGLASLRILKLRGVTFIGGIEGLGELRNLTHCTWFPSRTWDVVPMGIVGHLPMSLKVLEIYREVVLESDVLVRCHYLVNLDLYGPEVVSLDLSNCWSLKSVTLQFIPKLQTVLGLGSRQSSCLQICRVLGCKNLVDIQGIDHLIGLKELELDINVVFRVPRLLTLTKLQVLKLYDSQIPNMCLKDVIPCQLRELLWSFSNSSEELNLSGCNQLEYLDLSWSIGLTSLSKLGDLPALQALNLKGCGHLLRLPDLSKSKKLQALYLGSLELHERDIQMLSELPMLESFERDGQSFELNLRRQKVLVQ